MLKCCVCEKDIPEGANAGPSGNGVGYHPTCRMTPEEVMNSLVTMILMYSHCRKILMNALDLAGEKHYEILFRSFGPVTRGRVEPGGLEMTIQDTICSLEELTKPYISHLIPIYNRPGIESAITILERVKRLEGDLFGNYIFNYRKENVE